MAWFSVLRLDSNPISHKLKYKNTGGVFFLTMCKETAPSDAQNEVITSASVWRIDASEPASSL